MDIDKLVVFAGPPCSGKTTIMRRLKSRDTSSLSDRLKIGDSERVCFINSEKLHKVNESSIDRLVLHYDFLGPIREQIEEFSKDPTLKIINNVKEIVFVTFYAKPSILSARLKKRKIKLITRFLYPPWIYPTIIKLRINKTNEEFCASSKHNPQYDKWFEFCKAYDSTAHWIMDTSTSPPQLFSKSEWTENNIYSK